MHQEWLEAKPSDRMDILYTGAHRYLNMHGFNSVHWTDISLSLYLDNVSYLKIRHSWLTKFTFEWLLRAQIRLILHIHFDKGCDMMQTSVKCSNDFTMQQGKEKGHTIAGSQSTLAQTRYNHTINSKYEDQLLLVIAMHLFDGTLGWLKYFLTLYVRSQLMMRGSLGRGALTRWSRFEKYFLKQSGKKTIWQYGENSLNL